MRLWYVLRARLRSLVFRAGREYDLNEELRFHLERDVERLMRRGLSRDEARQQARRLFGGVEQIKEASRDARGTANLDALARDIRDGSRRLWRDWRFTTAAVVILGLAIGVNTAIFSLVNAVLLRPQTSRDPARLVNIYQNDRAGKPLVVTTYTAYTEITEYKDVFAAVTAGSIPSPFRYLYDGAIRTATVEYATSTYLDVLGLRPTLGRWFDQAEERRATAVVGVLGYQAWTRVFHADPDIIGRLVWIEGVPVTIVGVGPAHYRGTIDVGVDTDVWLPITALPAIVPIPALRDAPTIHVPLIVKARLRQGVSVSQASAAMDALGRRLVAEFPEEYRDNGGEFALGAGMTVLASNDVRIHPQADAPIAAIAGLVLIIVGLVLALACSNLATLLLVRGTARAKEIAVRLAMGATRRQLVRHLLIESVELSLMGGIVGCLVAWWSMRALQALDLPVTVDLTLDYRVLAFAIAVSLLTGILFGLAPALKATRVDLVPALRDEGSLSIERGSLPVKHALIVVQVAISVLLLGGTSICLQQLTAVRALHVGFAVDGVAMLETDLRFAGYSAARAEGLYSELLRRVAAVPGVQSAALSRGLPMAVEASVPIVVEHERGDDIAVPRAAMIWAGPGFFDTLRIPLLYGRVFDTRDRADTPRVAVITDTMARQRFGRVNAVGRRFQIKTEPNSWMEVIGVVRDTGTGNFDNDVLDPVGPLFYRSYTQAGLPPTTVVARTAGSAAALVGAMQRHVRALDVTLPVITASTMAQQMANSQAAPKAVATLFAVLGLLGMFLASIGLYAVVAFAVERRAREIGIRMALGARRGQVVWNIARGVAGLLAIGTSVGLFLSVLAMLALRAAPTGNNIGIGNIAVYRPNVDPVALLAIAAVTAVVGLAAAFVPARRAALMEPLAALRHE